MAEEKLTAKDLKTIEKAVKELFATLEIEGGFELSETEEAIDIVMDTKDSGMVIGYHGEGLESLQLIVSLMIAKKIGKFIRVSIEVDGYKKNRTEYLERLASQMKERALEENREQVVESLKSWERRIVHMLLQEDDQVTSESAGEGRDRVLIIKPKN
jgi:spoIIIJ-associated protein